MRWLVERSSGTDNFEDVGARYVEVIDGCLVFKDEARTLASPTLIIAAGEWRTVCEAAE